MQEVALIVRQVQVTVGERRTGIRYEAPGTATGAIRWAPHRPTQEAYDLPKRDAPARFARMT